MLNWLTPETVNLLIKGLWLTLWLTLITSVLSLVIGVYVGSLRIWGRRWVSLPAAIFVETFRNIPALVLIIFFAFAVPNVFPAQVRQALFFNNPIINATGSVSGLSVPWYAIAAVLGLTLNTAAYIAELFRAGVGTIASEHVDAAQSMGASWPIIFRAILIPGGLKAAYPAISSRLIHNFKNTALVSFVAVPEFFNSISTAINRSFMAIEFLMLAAVVYLLLSIGLSAGLRRLEPYLYRTPSTGRSASA